MKHPQHILAFDRQRFTTREPFQVIAEQQFYEMAEKSLFIGRRHELETDERFGQIIPYVILHNHGDHGTNVFAYRRTEMVGEERLAGNLSIGFGGHTDLADAVNYKGIIDVRETMKNVVNRELNEELLFTNHKEHTYTYDSLRQYHSCDPMFLGIINDQSNEVGRVHTGIVYLVFLPDGIDAKCRESELQSIGMTSPADLLQEDKTENWTRIMLQYMTEELQL